MKKLEDFADEINKCSKCGMCQAACPLYKLTGNDCAVSRGKFVMLDGVLKGDLKLGKNIEKYLDMCLKCGKCKGFCPSSIDVCEILNVAKAECAKETLHGKIIKFLQSRLVFGNLIKFGKVLSLTRISKLAVGWGKVVAFPTKNIGTICRGKSDSVPNQNDTGLKPTKLLYFKGCVNEVFPSVANAFIKICSHLDNVEIIERDFECCGLPFLSSGNLERYEEVKKHNLELMNCEFDYLLTDCASCESTLKGYSSNFADPTTENNTKLFINAAEFLAEQKLKFRFKKPVRVTFHKPCHLEEDGFLHKLLEKCENVEYIEMKDYDECCGFAGEFAIKNSKLSIQLAKQKAENAYATGADYVLTSCPACVLGLREGFWALGKKAPKIMNVVEFLALAEIE